MQNILPISIPHRKTRQNQQLIIIFLTERLLACTAEAAEWLLETNNRKGRFVSYIKFFMYLKGTRLKEYSVCVRHVVLVLQLSTKCSLNTEETLVKLNSLQTKFITFVTLIIFFKLQNLWKHFLFQKFLLDWYWTSGLFRKVTTRLFDCKQ